MTQRIDFLKKTIWDKTEDMEKIGHIIETDYKNKEGMNELLRKSSYLKAFAEKIPVVINKSELICGSMRFWRLARHSSYKNFNKGHIIVDYRMILRLGISGIQKKISELKTKESVAFGESIDAFCVFIKRYRDAAKNLDMNEVAENCSKLLENPPATFWEALQLIWFVHLFLHAEGMAAAVSFGRFDDYLYPFYKNDIESGIMTQAKAKELVSCFWLKACEGDESQAITLGGDVENELTYLCLEVTEELKMKQPSVCVRVNENSSDKLWQKIASLTKTRIGMPAVFNDRVVTKSLIDVGIKKEDAENYAIVGCYEANPDGKAYGLTAYGGGFHLFDVLLDFLKLEEEYEDFDGFYYGFKNYLKSIYNTRILDEFRTNWDDIKKYCVSPFQGLCMSGCLESGIAAEHGGGEYTMFGINILGIGTVIDSIYVIKKLVFEEKRYSLKEIEYQVVNNFTDQELQLLCRNMPGKYGTDNTDTNNMAEDLSGFIAELVKDGKIEDGVIAYAGLFMFLSDIRSSRFPATPDGRSAGERISYGIAASDIVKGKTVTSQLNSASHIKNDKFPDGNPMMISLGIKETEGECGDEIIKSLIKGYFENGGFHILINITDAEVLKDAKTNPERYEDLLIRISGYSEYFTRLEDAVQNALIERSQ